jgi:hypothetical protein
VAAVGLAGVSGAELGPEVEAAAEAAAAGCAALCHLLEKPTSYSCRPRNGTYLVHHANDEALLLDLVRLDGIVIFQNFAWSARQRDAVASEVSSRCAYQSR